MLLRGSLFLQQSSGATVENNCCLISKSISQTTAEAMLRRCLLGPPSWSSSFAVKFPIQSQPKLITCFHVKVQGNPRAGKTFPVLRPMHFSIASGRRVHDKHSKGRLIAPISCAARLSDDEPSHRFARYQPTASSWMAHPLTGTLLLGASKRQGMKASFTTAQMCFQYPS